LGSFAVITDVMGNIVQKCSYDAWGNREFEVKDPSLIFDRGFTGHEHLPEFGLINMNGRMYDPVVGRFLSPDPYVVDPQYNQDYNRYSYARNNPLIFTDPDGEWIILVGAIIVAYLGGSAANQNFNPVKWDYGSGATWMGMIGGAIQGAASVAGLQAGFAQMGWSNLATFGRSASTANLLTGRIPYVLLMLNCIKNFLLLQKNQKLKGMCLAEVILPFINRGMFLAGVILPFINRGMFLAGVILPFINRRMCLAEVILPFINRGMFLAGVILPFINRGMFLAGVILPFINRRMCLAEVILPFINRGMFLAGVILPFTNRGMCLAGVILPFANRRMSLAGVIAPCEDLCILPAEFPLRFAA
jgi:RHS repeat-associated protein